MNPAFHSQKNSCLFTASLHPSDPHTFIVLMNQRHNVPDTDGPNLYTIKISKCSLVNTELWPDGLMER